MYAKKALVFAAGVATASAACPTQVQLPGGVGSIFQPDGSHTPTIGKPFSILFDGTGLGPTFSFELLRGPGEALVSLGIFASGVPNCGTASCSYSWTPASTLEPDTTHYGIKLIDESSCQFQYTTQFGLNAGDAPPSSSSKAVVQSTSSTPVPPPSSSSSSKPAPPPSSSSKPSSSSSPNGPPKPSGSPKPDGPSGPNGPPKPSGATPPQPLETDCEDATVTAWTSVYKPKPTGGFVATNGTAVISSKTNATAFSPTYTPVQANEAGRVTFGAVGALAAFIAVMLY